MQKQDHDIQRVQIIIQHFDVKKCKLISSWLSDYIKSLEVDEALFKISLQQLHLSNRTFNVLQANNINSIGQLMKRSSDWDNIKKLRGAGDKVQHEIREKVTQVQAGKID